MRAPLNLRTALALLALAVPAAAEEAEFKVVVNAANPASEATHAQIGDLFLKRTTRWPSGAAVAPVDQSITLKVRAAFSQRVLRLSSLGVQKYWQEQIFSGRDVPPPVKPSDQEVLAFVRANAGAIGYVSAGASLPESTKTLRIVP